MIIVIARGEVDPADIPMLRPALAAMMRATWDESGCLSYSMALDSAERGVVTITERWQDEAALQEHFESGHMATFKTAAAGLFRSLDAMRYDVSGERVLPVEI